MKNCMYCRIIGNLCKCNKVEIKYNKIIFMEVFCYFLCHWPFVCSSMLTCRLLSLIRRGQMEKRSIAQDIPVAKAAYTFLQDNVSSSFFYPGWSKGRIVCQRSQLKRILSATNSFSEESRVDNLIALSNLPISSTGVKSSTSGVNQLGDVISGTKMRTRTEIMAGTV